METLDLHYSRARLIKLALYSLLGTALFLWAATGGISETEDGSGRRAWVVRLLGPEGLQVMGWVGAAVMATLTLLYLRRAFADPVAARANSEGVTIHMLLASRFYAARDIERIELRRPMGQAILEVVPVAGRGKKGGLTVNGLAEEEDEVETWIDAVQAAQAGR